jgi:serralysin
MTDGVWPIFVYLRERILAQRHYFFVLCPEESLNPRLLTMKSKAAFETLLNSKIVAELAPELTEIATLYSLPARPLEIIGAVEKVQSMAASGISLTPTKSIDSPASNSLIPAPSINSSALTALRFGQGTAVTANTLTVDSSLTDLSLSRNVNALMHKYRWAKAPASQGPTTVTFSFTDNIADYESNYLDTFPASNRVAIWNNHKANFKPLATDQRTTVRSWLTNEFFNVSGLIFTELSGAQDRDATIRIAVANVSLPQEQAAETDRNHTFTVGSSGVSEPRAGDIWYRSGSNDSVGNSPSGVVPKMGTYGHFTIGHELGHALGLKHSHQTNDENLTSLTMTSDRDSMEFSIMSYRSYIGAPTGVASNEEHGYSQTLMMYDIRAIQQMYGAWFSYQPTNTTYKFSTTTGEMSINNVGQGAPSANRIFRTIWDGDGVDTYDFSNYATRLSIDLTPGGWSDLDVGGDKQRAKLDRAPSVTYATSPLKYARGHVFNALQYKGDIRSLIENANGGSGNDYIQGNIANNDLKGNNGNDTIRGLEGNDTLWGDLGNDSLYGDAGNDSVLAGYGNDFVDGGIGNDTITGFYGNDYLLGGFGNDFLFGDSGDDSLRGGAGNDTLSGGLGNDYAYGDEGNDFVIGTVGDKLLDGGAGIDTLQFEGSTNVTVDLATGTTSYGGRAINFEVFIASAGSDILYGSTGNDALYGGAGSDIINGNAGNDSLYGGVGNDALYGGLGSDSIEGGDGDDIVEGTFGDIKLDGGAGIDILSFSSVPADFNNYNINLATGVTNFGGSAVNFESLFTNSGNDTLVGSAANNTIGSGAGNDRISGGAGNDQLVGYDGNDTLYGDAGNDTVDGGFGNNSGNDLLYGGAGVDFFMLNRVGVDTIADFVSAGIPTETDRLVVSASVFGLIEGPFGSLNSSSFRIGAGATTANSASQRFIFNTTDRSLYFDAGGNTGAASIKIASLSSTATINTNNFFVIF